MSTNYYIKLKKPRIVKMKDYASKHLGKSSAGNRFTIQTQPELYNNFEEFKKFLMIHEEYNIVDEYGRKENVEDFLRYIEKTGYEFEDREFS